jgi:prefoldin subunit 5
MRSIVVATFIFVLSALPALAQGGTDGFVRAATVQVPLTGREVAIPVPPDAEAADLRVVITGTVTCAINGRTYDAGSPHVAHAPGSLRMVEQDASAHRYVLRPEADAPAPEAVTARVDVDRLVRELIVTPSEVRNSLSGDVRLELWRAKRDNGLAGVLLPVGGALAILLVLAVVSARRSRGMADIDEALKRIDRRVDAARRAARDRDWDSEELERKLDDLQRSARHLASEIRRFRSIARSVDRSDLERDIDITRRRLEATDREETRRLVQSLLDAKLKLRDMLVDSEATEERYKLRLAHIEATLETLVVQMAEQDGRMAATDADREAIDALQSELSATDAAIEELKLIEDPGKFDPGE